MRIRSTILGLAIVFPGVAALAPWAHAASTAPPNLLSIRKDGPYATIAPRGPTRSILLHEGPFRFATRPRISHDFKGAWASSEVLGGNAFGFNNVAGNDGNVCYAIAIASPSGLLSVSPAFVATFDPINVPNAFVTWTAPGPSGDMWFHDTNNESVGQLIVATGQVTEYPLPTTGFLFGMTLGPDGNIWSDCGQGSVICRVATPGSSIGNVTQFPLPSGQNNILLAAGHDGNVWFTTGSSSPLGKIDPSTGDVTMVGGPAVSLPAGITTDPTGAYFSTSQYGSAGNTICKVAYKALRSGYKCHAIPAKLTGLGGGNIGGLALGKKGDIFFPYMGHVGQFDPKTNAYADLGQDPHPALFDSNAAATGADGNFWTLRGQSPSTVEVRAIK